MSPRARIRLPAAIAVALFAVAFGLLTWARARDSDWIVALAGVCLLLAATLQQVISSRVRKGWIPFVIAAAGVLLVGLWWLGTQGGFLTGAWGLAGVCLVYLGIGQLLAQVRSRDTLSPG